jgi:hypothetical protein
MSVSKSQVRRAKEAEGPELEHLNYKAYLYTLKHVDKFQRKATKPDGNIHGNFDWGFEFRKRMCAVADLRVEKTSSNRVASDFRNGVGPVPEG